jgi:hypothetical protein
VPEFENVRSTARAIGRVTCIETGVEIGLLYQWDNGETQAALNEDSLPEAPENLERQIEPFFEADPSQRPE